jgi:hypothetical protein
MLGISNLHYQGAKGHIYSTCIGRKYAENPLTDGENTIYNIYLTQTNTSYIPLISTSVWQLWGMGVGVWSGEFRGGLA